MSNEHLASENRLASLRRIAEADIACEQCSDVNPRELLALVECAEALVKQCDTGCECEDCRAGRAVLARLEAL